MSPETSLEALFVVQLFLVNVQRCVETIRSNDMKSEFYTFLSISIIMRTYSKVIFLSATSSAAGFNRKNSISIVIMQLIY